MTPDKRVTRRLRGLGFHPDGDKRWVRSHAPPDRSWSPYRRYGWWGSRFSVMLGNDGLSVFAVGQEYRRGRGSKCYHGLKSVDVERLIESGLTLADAVAVIKRELQTARCRGQMNGWWHEKKERS